VLGCPNNCELNHNHRLEIDFLAFGLSSQLEILLIYLNCVIR